MSAIRFFDQCLSAPNHSKPGEHPRYASDKKDFTSKSFTFYYNNRSCASYKGFVRSHLHLSVNQTGLSRLIMSAYALNLSFLLMAERLRLLMQLLRQSLYGCTDKICLLTDSLSHCLNNLNRCDEELGLKLKSQSLFQQSQPLRLLAPSLNLWFYWLIRTIGTQIKISTVEIIARDSETFSLLVATMNSSTDILVQNNFRILFF